MVQVVDTINPHHVVCFSDDNSCDLNRSLITGDHRSKKIHNERSGSSSDDLMVNATVVAHEVDKTGSSNLKGLLLSGVVSTDTGLTEDNVVSFLQQVRHW
jgi:hypothetical protein